MEKEKEQDPIANDGASEAGASSQADSKDMISKERASIKTDSPEPEEKAEISIFEARAITKSSAGKKVASILVAFLSVFFVVGFVVFTVLTVDTTQKLVITLSYSDTENYQQEINKGSIFMVPNDPTRAGYTFEGWFANKERTIPFDFEKAVKQNTTIYVKWNIRKYTLSFRSNKVGDEELINNFNLSVFAGTREITYGQTVVIENDSSKLGSANWTFSRFNTREDGSGKDYFLGDSFEMPASNLMLFAIWN